jgi:hypothetical protein
VVVLAEWNPTLCKSGKGWGTHGMVSSRRSGIRSATRPFRKITTARWFGRSERHVSCVRGVKSHPLQKRQRMGHLGDGEFEKKRDEVGDPSVPQDYDSKVVRRSERHVSCVGGVKSHPLQKRQRMGHPRYGELKKNWRWATRYSRRAASYTASKRVRASRSCCGSPDFTRKSLAPR